MTFTISKYIHSGMNALEACLEFVPEVSYDAWPTDPASFHHLSTLIANKDKRVDYCFAFGEGLELAMEDCAKEDPIKQNAYYPAWLAGVYCSCVIVFTPLGMIIWAAFNFPGSFHDSKVSENLYNLLSNHTPPGMRLLVDSAFKSSGKLKDHVRKPMNKADVANMALPEYVKQLLLQQSRCGISHENCMPCNCVMAGLLRDQDKPLSGACAMYKGRFRAFICHCLLTTQCATKC